jgi:hypothetical protein
VAVGDFNGDGLPDLVFASDSGWVDVLLNIADEPGTFPTTPNYSYSGFTGTRSVAVGNFFGSNFLDLAVANSGGSTVSVLPGNGDGSFNTTAEQTYTVGTNTTTGSNPYYVAVGDFNEDGLPDLVVANYNDGPPGTVSVLLNNGSSTSPFSSCPSTVVSDGSPYFRTLGRGDRGLQRGWLR